MSSFINRPFSWIFKEGKMRKAIDYMKTHPIFTGTFGVALAVAAIKALNPDGKMFLMALLRLVLIFAVSMFIYLISGTKSFEKCHTTTGYEFKWGLLLVIPAAVISLFFLISIFSGVLKPVEDWYVRLLGALCLFFTVGFFEELTFRVLVNDAMLYKFRNSKHIFALIAIIGSFIFGFVHVVDGGMFASPMNFATAMLKTASTGLAGFCYLILYWKTRNVVGIALAHGLYDFLTVGIGQIADKEIQVGGAKNYVGAGEEGIIFYIADIFVTIIAALILWKKVGKTIDFEEIRKTW